jgi:pimeloyl-ACP methyl ester carboxylesterase
MSTQPSRSTLGLRNPDGYLSIDGCEVGWAAFPALAQTNVQTVVCLHDIGSGSREFQPVLERQPGNTRLIAYDWPNHGNSAPMPDAHADTTGPESTNLIDQFCGILHSVLHQLEVPQPIILLGSGFGATVAIRFASQNPSAILGIVVCQPAGLIPSRSSRPGFWASCVPQWLRSKEPNSPPNDSDSSAAAHRQALRLEALQPEMRPLLNAAEVSMQQSQSALRTDLIALDTPVLFALSRDSRKYPLRDYIELLDPLLARSPQHRITVFTGNFHPAWDEPNRFAQAVNGFIQSQLPVANHHHAWLLTAVDYPAENMNLWKCVHPECNLEQALPAETNPNAI